MDEFEKRSLSDALLGDSIREFESASDKIVELEINASEMRDVIIEVSLRNGVRGRETYVRWMSKAREWDDEHQRPMAECLFDPCLPVRCDAIATIVLVGQKAIDGITKYLYGNEFTESTLESHKFLEEKYDELSRHMPNENWLESSILKKRQVRALHIATMLISGSTIKEIFEKHGIQEDSYVLDWLQNYYSM